MIRQGAAGCLTLLDMGQRGAPTRSRIPILGLFGHCQSQQTPYRHPKMIAMARRLKMTLERPRTEGARMALRYLHQSRTRTINQMSSPSHGLSHPSPRLHLLDGWDGLGGCIMVLRRMSRRSKAERKQRIPRRRNRHNLRPPRRLRARRPNPNHLVLRSLGPSPILGLVCGMAHPHQMPGQTTQKRRHRESLLRGGVKMYPWPTRHRHHKHNRPRRQLAQLGLSGHGMEAQNLREEHQC